MFSFSLSHFNLKCTVLITCKVYLLFCNPIFVYKNAAFNTKRVFNVDILVCIKLLNQLNSLFSLKLVSFFLDGHSSEKNVLYLIINSEQIKHYYMQYIQYTEYVLVFTLNDMFYAYTFPLILILLLFISSIFTRCCK